MNRLTDIYLGTTHSQITYDPLGRMTSKQADGQTVFANAGFAPAAGQPARPHAMKSAATTEGVFPDANQSIAYTSFDKVKAIVEDGNGIIINYGYDQQRIRMYEIKADGNAVNKDYVGVCEYVTESFGTGGGATLKTFTYLVGPYGVFAVVEHGDEERIHYILKDHLGSWTTITNAEGVVEQELSFDAWGNLRNPATWCGNFSGTPMFDRGFTGHEHISDFGLINMNGRCYDPLTSSFLSVDAYVQDPTSAQAFNRYAYCAHNPLRYTDPTGWYYGSQTNYVNPNINSGHTTYYSEDPNDVLWGRSVHPCGNSSSGYVNGTAVTCTGYTEGNGSAGGGSPNRVWLKLANGEIGWYPNVYSKSVLDEAGVEILGKSYIDENNHLYYSQLGLVFDMNLENGMVGRLMPIIDQALEKYSIFLEAEAAYNTNQSNVEPIHGYTDFSSVVEYDYGKKGLQSYDFSMGPVDFHFQVHNKKETMNARALYIDFEKPKDINSGYGMVNWNSGYNVEFVSKINQMSSNPRNIRILTITFTSESSWNSFRNRYNAAFGNH